jgi:hypothetical protein
VIEVVIVYHQVYDIMDEEASDRKRFSMERESHVITSLFVLTWVY